MSEIQIQQNHTRLTVDRNDNSIPFYYMLVTLGIWRPKHSHMVFKLYFYFSYVILAVVLILLVLLSITKGHFNTGMFVNGISTMINLCSSFFFCRWYFNTGHYDELLKHFHSSFPMKYKFLCQCYSCFTFILWVLIFPFYFIHWISFFIRLYEKIICGVALFFVMGWWACWISLYVFVCHLFKIKIENFHMEMLNAFNYSERTSKTEEACVLRLLHQFDSLDKWLRSTQDCFSKIISLSMVCHLMNLFVFSTAYMCNDLGKDFDSWKYYGHVAFDVFSIFSKLVPAAYVCQNLHKVIVGAGEHCYPDIYTGEVLRERLLFYQHIVLREQDMGLYILGVKITSKFTVGLFATVTTVFLTFIKYAIPYLKSYLRPWNL
ncbi:uncharacterized protein LOC136079886 [Hydra vulgaris]|uniref:uncharacterized protein LOC136079886 n=1 Tax=Hydra vulgaris TaxID=6087 RepID=UPI0032EA52B1